MSRPSSRRRRLALAVLALACALPAACTSAPEKPAEQLAAERYLTAFGTARATVAAGQTDDPTTATTTLTKTVAGLDGARGRFVVRQVSTKGASSTVRYAATWTVPGSSKPWTYAGTLPMTRVGEVWKVDWSPAAVFPGLVEGQHLTLVRAQPPRADLLDRSGQPLFSETKVVDVGVQPSKVEDLAGLAGTLAQVFGISADDIVADVKAAANPDAFVPVITVRDDLYQSVKPQIYAIPGTVFRSDTRLLTRATGWGQPLLGSVGEATKEIVDASKGAVAAGDTVGLSGLQRAYDATLRGTAGVDVYSAADVDGTTAKKLATAVPAVPGKDVRLTIDPAAQGAATTVLAGVAEPASVVAVQMSTGEILAAADSASAPGTISLTGQYPAGSTFKIVTYGAAFSASSATTPGTQAGCPGTRTVDGRTFQNEDAFDKGTVSLRDAFAYSCNTTAIELALGLPADALPDFAAEVGIGADWDLPVDAFSGSIPVPTGQTEQAADAIGQGKVLVSPLAMAAAAGAAYQGFPVPPSLEMGEQGKPGATIDANVTAELKTVMRAVVAEPIGTAHALAGLPGEIAGKTGTAEFGTDTPPKSHSWFVGVRGDLAIAVFVYGGESSKDTAVPLAQQFLTAYA